MRVFIPALFVVGVAASASASAQTLNAPIIKAGDTWTYRTTTEKGASGWNQTRDETTVSRVTSSTIYYTVKASGSTQSPKELFAGPDWSRARDIDGKETVVNRPLAFPLTTGKAWEVRYTEQHPNKTFRSEEWLNNIASSALKTSKCPRENSTHSRSRRRVVGRPNSNRLKRSSKVLNRMRTGLPW
jgi:hypothetical protein